MSKNGKSLRVFLPWLQLLCLLLGTFEPTRALAYYNVQSMRSKSTFLGTGRTTTTTTMSAATTTTTTRRKKGVIEMRLYQVPPSQDEDDTDVTLIQPSSSQTSEPANTEIEIDAATTNGFIPDSAASSNDLTLYNAAPLVSGVLITGFSLFLTFYGFYAGISGTDPIFQQYPTTATTTVVQVI